MSVLFPLKVLQACNEHCPLEKVLEKVLHSEHGLVRYGHGLVCFAEYSLYEKYLKGTKLNNVPYNSITELRPFDICAI